MPKRNTQVTAMSLHVQICTQKWFGVHQNHCWKWQKNYLTRQSVWRLQTINIKTRELVLKFWFEPIKLQFTWHVNLKLGMLTLKGFLNELFCERFWKSHDAVKCTYLQNHGTYQMLVLVLASKMSWNTICVGVMQIQVSYTIFYLKGKRSIQ